MNMLFQIQWMAVAIAATSSAQLTLHVAPGGDDSSVGTPLQPLATLAGARDRIRERRMDTERDIDSIRVVLHQGEYQIDETVEFTDLDSGIAGAPIVYTAESGEAVRFTGGCRLECERWKPLADPELINRLAAREAAEHIRVFDLQNAGIDVDDVIHPRGFPQPIRPAPFELFVNGKPMTLARYPNEGFVHVADVSEPGAVATDEQPMRLPAFTFDDARFGRWTKANEIWAFGYWKWDWADECLRVESLDPETGQITLAAPHRYGVQAGAAFFVENLLEELDQPGEYFVDRDSKQLFFWPPEAIDKSVCHLSLLGQPMLHFQGANHIRLEGLTFEHARGDAIVIDDGSDVVVRNCALRNLGNRAVVVTNGVDHTIDRCLIEQTGEGGVTLSGGDRRTLRPCNHRVTNCRIRDFSRRTATYRPAVRMSGVGCRVDHSELFDAPHSAIIYGGNDHLIESNDIHHVLSRTGDGGAVYCGRDWTIRGTVIRWNHFHDLVGIRKWENAVYVDDQASGITIRENLFTNCHWGMLMGGGRDNVIEGNVFIDCGLALHFDARGLGWAARLRDTLVSRLNAVPYRDEPWATRFPQLGTLLDDDPMVPKGNIVRGNLLIRSGQIDQDMAAQVKAHSVVEENHARDDEPAADDPAAAILRSILQSIHRGDVGPRRHR